MVLINSITRDWIILGKDPKLSKEVLLILRPFSNCQCSLTLNLAPGTSGSPGNEPQPTINTTELVPCLGNANQYCGAPGYQLIYQLRPSPLTAGNILNPWVPPGDNNFTYVSTWTDTSNTGIFVTTKNGGYAPLQFLSVEYCLTVCVIGSQHWQYTGIENGKSVQPSL